MFWLKRLLLKKLSVIHFFIPFIIITDISGGISFYSIYNYNSSILNIIDVVVTAKNTQIELEKQFNNEKAILFEGTSFTIYKQKIHEFSYNSQHIQNSLFNLYLMCSDMDTVSKKIQNFSRLYKEINDEMVAHIINYPELSEKSYNELIVKSIKNQKTLMQMIDDLVAEIEVIAGKKIEWQNKYYLMLGLISFGMMTLFAITISFYSSNLINRFRKKLEIKVRKRTEQLQKAHDQLTLSETKYRFLVESADDLIFTLDTNGIIVTVNSAVKKYLKVTPSSVTGKIFYDLLYFDNDPDNFKKNIFIKNIEQNMAEKQKVKFFAQFKTMKMIEPMEMVVTLECVKFSGGDEIIGKATRIIEDEIINSFMYEHVKYEICNSLLVADEITHRIVLNARKFLPGNIVTQLRLAISEIIINAIEHGNLEITYEDKLIKMQSDEYFEYISGKMMEDKNKEKKVKVEFLLNSEKIVVKITDQGKGFNYAKYLDKQDIDTSENFLQHGRGIALAKEIFDEIKYNDKGNQVIMTKYFNTIQNNEISAADNQVVLR